MTLGRRFRHAWLVCALLASILLCSCMNVNPYATDAVSGESLADRVASGTSIKAERGSKTLDIVRKLPGAKEPSGISKDTWTVFVYLCGSDLETRGGAATLDLYEMTQASGNKNVSFVVQTGGARQWQNNTVSAGRLGRYLIRGGKMYDEGSVKAANMGSAKTLADFLAWGIQNHPADHMGLILWDHGGGSIAGACFDERNDNDSLFLREIDEALGATFDSMWEKLEFVGFDACLMSTLETANVLASYANYMIASQESEPGSGWEYRTMMEYLSEHPSCTGEELGKQVCDSYLATVDHSSRGFVTLSVVDLSKIDQLMQDFYRFSQEMYESGADQGTLAAMSRGIQKVPSYGSNNRREGYTNMVDLGGLVDACAEVTPSAADVKATLNEAVRYQIRGTYHADATGLSLFYPLRVNTARELSVFETVALNPSYLQYVDRLAHGATYDGGTPYQEYSGDTFYEDNIWYWLLGNTYEMQEQTEDYWQYVDDHRSVSMQVTFADEPQVDDEGTYWFKFDQKGIDRAAVVSGLLYRVAENGQERVALGETYDVYGDWETGEFADGFDGKWLSLPDGQNLNLTVVSSTDEHIRYSSPIKLNDTDCYLRLCQNIEDGSVEVEGAWNGVSEQGAVDRDIIPLQEGDVIVPRYDAADIESEVVENHDGQSYTVGSDGLAVSYDLLPEGIYEYRFCITDVFGDSFLTDAVRFVIEADGTVYAE